MKDEQPTACIFVHLELCEINNSRLYYIQPNSGDAEVVVTISLVLKYLCS